MVDFVRATEAAVQVRRRKAEAEVQVPKEKPTEWFSYLRNTEYIRHVSKVPTPKIRGVATSFVELAQDWHEQSEIFRGGINVAKGYFYIRQKMG